MSVTGPSTPRKHESRDDAMWTGGGGATGPALVWSSSIDYPSGADSEAIDPSTSGRAPMRLSALMRPPPSPPLPHTRTHVASSPNATSYCVYGGHVPPCIFIVAAGKLVRSDLEKRPFPRPPAAEGRLQEPPPISARPLGAVCPAERDK